MKVADVADPLIAVVDDDFRITEALENLFVSAGYDVSLFSSAEAFLTSSNVLTLCCLISDIEMPGIKGDELVSIVRATDKRLPIILISGHRDGMEEAVFSRLGANDFFAKPFSATNLLERVKELIDQRPH